jgi:hypothetical protein
MANGRRPIFELHIRPMFRLLDQVHMLRLPAPKRLDLTDYQQVRDRHQQIRELIGDASSMPPAETGGPWPQEWIDLFDHWKTTGFGRLTQPIASNFRLTLTAPERYTLSCSVTLPNSNSFAWLDIVKAQPDAQIYSIAMEVPEEVPPAPISVAVEERIRGPLTVAEAVIVDGAGEHRVTVPTA